MQVPAGSQQQPVWYFQSLAAVKEELEEAFGSRLSTNCAPLAHGIHRWMLREGYQAVCGCYKREMLRLVNMVNAEYSKPVHNCPGLTTEYKSETDQQIHKCFVDTAVYSAVLVHCTSYRDEQPYRSKLHHGCPQLDAVVFAGSCCWRERWIDGSLLQFCVTRRPFEV